MASNFPTSLDTLTNPSGTDAVSSSVGGRTHAQMHTDVNDIVEALEAKVGVDGSAVTSSHDYKLSGVTGSDKAVSLAGTETLTNKTLTDSSTTFQDNVDNTKKFQFQVSGVTAGQTRTLTVPDASTTLVGTDNSQTLTGKTLAGVEMSGDANFNNNDITEIKTAVFNGEYDNGNSGTSKTIDWNNGQKQKITTTGSCTLTFTAPAGPCNLLLKIVHEASATSYTYTWPASVKFPGNTDPTTTNTSGAVDIVSLYFDGTNYYGVGNANFS